MVQTDERKIVKTERKMVNTEASQLILFISAVIFAAAELLIGSVNVIWGKCKLDVNAQERGWRSIINGVILSGLLILIYLLLF